MDGTLTVTRSIQDFLSHANTLRKHNNPDLLRRWHPNLETQINVIEGELVEGFNNVYTDGQFTWSNIRIPKKANSEPEWYNYEMKWPLDLYAEGVGITGWNFVDRVSVSVGYDFDSIISHGNGLDAEQLERVKEAAKALDFVTARKSSSGGDGLHLEVPLANIPTRNHTEHARLAKIILEKMSHDANFNFASSLDVCGKVLWIWSRKSTAANGGLSPIKDASRPLTADDLPSDWQERIKSEPRSERPENSNPASKYVIKAAQRYIAACESVGHGSRNKSATSIAGHLAVFEGRRTHSRLSEEQIYRMLQGWSDRCDPPMDDSELRSCVQGGMYRGTPPETKWVDEGDDADVHESIREASNLSPASIGEQSMSQESQTSETYRPFPVDCFPSPTNDYIRSAAAAIGCDPSYVGTCMLPCLARAVGNKRRVRLKRRYFQPAIVWGAIVGKSGTAKTPAMNAAIEFVTQRENDVQDKNKATMQRHEEAKKLHYIEMKKWEQEAKKSTHDNPARPMPKEPDEPTFERYITSDCTIEALAMILSQQKDGLLVVRDELSGWLNGMGEHKKQKNGDSAKWLEMWSGSQVKVDRVSRKSIHVRRACVSVCGGIQPGVLKQAIGREHFQDGLCARLLLAMPPDQTIKWSDREIDPHTESKMTEVFERLFLIETPDNPATIRLKPEAEKVWVEYQHRHADEMKGLSDDLRAAWAKLEQYTARFALIFECVKGGVEIEAATMQSAIELSDWFGHEARRVYAMLAASHDPYGELVEWIAKRGGQVTARELAQGNSRYKKAGTAKAALDELVSLQRGRWETVTTNGRPAEVFKLAG